MSIHHELSLQDELDLEGEIWGYLRHELHNVGYGAFWLRSILGISCPIIKDNFFPELTENIVKSRYTAPRLTTNLDFCGRFLSQNFISNYDNMFIVQQNTGIL